jgi:hypothetical protein
MQKTKDKSKKSKRSGDPASAGIKVSHLQTLFNLFFVKFAFDGFHNVLKLLSLAFCPRLAGFCHFVPQLLSFIGL